MKPLKIVFTSDCHIGLRVDGNDQTPDIIEVIKRVVEKAREYQEDGHETVLIFGGDIFDSNDPSEYQIGAFISVLALIKQYNIKTYVMVGNHEARANPQRLSCLSFIKDASVGFPSISLVEDISSIEYGDSVNGKVFFTFLPHVSKALIEKKKLKVTPQEYIDQQCAKIMRKMERQKCDHIIFSHLNVKGVHGGSEENLLKRSDVYLPTILTENCLSGIKPTIIQAHVHTRSTVDNLHIIGSPVFCSFNEHGEKGFAVMTVGRDIGSESGIGYFPSYTTEFIECEIDMIGQSEAFFKLPEVKEMLRNVPKDQKSVLKIDVTINPENNTYDWKKIQEKLQDHFKLSIVKAITPRIVSKRLVRNPNQKASLSPDQALQSFIKTNWKQDKEKARSIYRVAKQYLQ